MIDGAGNPWYRADVGIAGGRIAEVGRVDEPAERVIDADGLFVCPGFIDMHTHSDLQLLVNPAARGEGAPGRDARRDRPGRPQLRARSPTRCSSSCAAQLAAWNDDPPGFDWSWRTVGEYLDRLDADGIAINAAYLAPHGTIRMIAMGTDDRPPTADELAHMKRLLAEALRGGRRRALDRADLHARDVRRRRRDRRAARGRPRARRLLHAAPPQLREARARGVRRLHRDRAPLRRAAAPRARAPRLRDQQGPGARAARDDRPGARRRDRGHARHLSLPRRLHLSRTRSCRAGCTSAAARRRSSGCATRRCASGCVSRSRTRAPTASTRSRWTGR